MYLKKVLCVALCLTTILATSACSVKKQNSVLSTEETYNMSSSLDAHAYCLFMNKEIEVVLNQLTTEIMLAKKVSAGEYPAVDALASVEASLKATEEAESEIEVMVPPEEYARNRENTLRIIQNVKSDFGTMIEILEGKTDSLNDLSSLAEIMQGDFIALTAEFDIYYK